MAKTKISEFSATPANNTDIDNINIAEGCAPSGINDAIRELMAQLKDFQTGAVGDSFNGPVGTTTAAAGAFTTLSASSTVSGTGFSTYLASPPAIGGTAAAAGSFTTLSASGNVTLSGGTANGVAYLNGSKVVTSGSALTFDGSRLLVGTTTAGVVSGGIRAVHDATEGTPTAVGDEVGWVQRNFNSSQSCSFAIVSGTASTSSLYLGDKDSINVGSLVYSNSDNSMRFNASGSEVGRFTSTGLGIGTSSPAYKLQVASGATSTTAFFSSTSTTAYGATGYNGGGARIQINGGNASGATTGINFSQGGLFEAYFGGVQESGGAAAFVWQGYSGSAYVERMRLDSAGNLGLGVTPSAWDSGFKVIQLGGGAYLGQYNNNAVQVGLNTYFNGTNYIYTTTNEASRFVQTDGQFQWFTAPSGTAGNAITFTQAMTLDASGALTIGATGSTKSVYAFNVINNSTFNYSGNGYRLATIRSGSGDQSGIEIGYDATAGMGIIGGSTQASGTGVAFWTYDGANWAERARIEKSGNLLVGTTSAPPISAGQFGIITALASSASSNAIIATLPTSATGKAFYSQSLTAGSTNWYHLIGASGNGSTLTTNTIFIYGNGNVENANNSYGAISDIKLKENIVDASPKLDKLMQVRIRNYNLKGDYEKHKQIGVVAQELETVFPSMIDVSPDRDAEGNDLGTTTKSVKYSVFVPMLIKAMQEQQAIIESLKARLDAANL